MDISTYLSHRNSNVMMADLGCPNSVIGFKDEKIFIRNLSNYQRDKLVIVKVDENYKFGPSGPFKCKEKLKFPINLDKKTKWVEIAIVDAEIPMLLGNNILKPLEAEIKLFASGDGIVKLGEVEMEMKETVGGHYTLNVQDLSKLCASVDASSYCNKKVFNCRECAKTFESEVTLMDHRRSMHEQNIPGSILKNPQNSNHSDRENHCLHKIISDLNTQLNSNLVKKEKSFVHILKQVAQIQQVENKQKCDLCKDTENMKQHQRCAHEVKLGAQCNLCDSELTNKDDCFQTLLSHHEEENEKYHDDLDPALWNILLTDEDESELTEAERKEIMKLHRYFAHRSGQ